MENRDTNRVNLKIDGMSCRIIVYDGKNPFYGNGKNNGTEN